MKDIWKANLKLFFILLIFLILSILSEIFLALLFGQIIDKAGNRELSAMFTLITQTLILMFLDTLVFWLFQTYTNKFIYIMVRDTKMKIFSSIQNQNMNQFFKEDIGNKISFLTNDMSILEEDYFKSIIFVIKAAILFIFSIAVIFVKSYQIAIFLIILTLVSFFLPKLFEKNLTNYKKNYSDSQSKYTSKVTEYLNGFDTIKSFNIIDTIRKNFFHSADYVAKKGTTYIKHYNFVRAIAIFFGSLTFMGSFLFGAYLVATGMLALGTMITCVQLTNHVTNPVYTLVDRISSFKSVSKILQKIKELPTIVEKEDETYKRHDKLEKDITIQNLSFSYENKEIFKNISFTFEKNKKYAIVGTSGSGKSTILKLLARKIQPLSGEISIDDININDLSEKSLLNLYSYISQNVFLFKGSIFDNITLYNDYEKEKVENILKIVGLEHFIKDMNNDDYIKENGSNLSGGEKQRISIARALIRDTDILIADEILSNLDNEVSLKIEENLLNLKDITLISVTHKLLEKILINYDEIIVLNKGNILEKGSFQELINQKSFFFNIYNLEKNDE